MRKRSNSEDVIYSGNSRLRRHLEGAGVYCGVPTTGCTACLDFR